MNPRFSLFSVGSDFQLCLGLSQIPKLVRSTDHSYLWSLFAATPVQNTNSRKKATKLLFIYELSFTSASFKHDSLKVTQQTTGKIRILFLGEGLFVFSLQRYYFLLGYI